MDNFAVEVVDLSVDFPIRTSLFRRPKMLQAVNGISLTIAEGETLGLVGESGSGKSTAGRAVLRLIKPTSGRVVVNGIEVGALSERQLRPYRRDMQIVFQDPYSSLDPSSIIADIIGEPLRVHENVSRVELAARVGDLLEMVGLPSETANRYPHEFSGGQRQRIAIARAIALNPKVIILDEALSALDVSTQGQILKLLERLRRELGIAFLFISHDLAVVRWLAHRTAVMYLGRIVEIGPTERVSDQPQHPYTKALLSAVLAPVPGDRSARERVVLSGDLPDPMEPPSGCPFRTRCQFAMDVCSQEMPKLSSVDGGGFVACHLNTPEVTP